MKPKAKAEPKVERYHHGDLRRALLDAALEMVTLEGAGALSLREVARRAGVSHAAPYRHFPSKEALIAAMAEEGFRRLHAAMRERSAPHGADPGRGFLEAGVGYVLFAVENPAHYRVMFSGLLGDGAAFPALECEAGAAFELLIQALTACQQAGLVRAGEPAELAVAAWSGVHGLAMLLIDRQLAPTGTGPEQAEALARFVTGVLAQGLQAPPTPPARDG